MRFLIVITLVGSCLLSKAQDIHFSQFFNSPIINNPGNTGFFAEDFRFAANQRVQWRSISDNPYNTFGLSAEKSGLGDYNNLSAGLNFLHDITGDSRYRTTEINLSGAYQAYISTDSAHRISAGLQLGFTRKSIDYTDLSFDSQYNGIAYDPTASSGENFLNEGRGYINLGTGLTYRYDMKERMWGEVGIGLFNLLKPRQSFFNDDDIQRDRRALIQLRGSYPVSLKWDIIPSFSFMFQGVYKELIFGNLGKYTLVNERGQYRALYGGLFYRGGDAGYAFIGMDYDNWHAGLSYDLNLSNLNPASLKRGGWEVALIYKMRYYKYKAEVHRRCPNYMK